MKSKVLQTTLLLICLSFSVALAKPRYKRSSDPFDNARLAIELGGGVPVGLISQNAINEKEKETDHPIYMDISPVIYLGLVVSYHFPLNKIYSIGPEIGMTWGFTKLTWHSFKEPERKIKIIQKETYMTVPLYVRFTMVHNKRFLMSSNLICGYDLTIFLTSTKQIVGYSPYLDKTYQDDIENYESAPNRQRISPGSMVLGYAVEFPKGFYLAGKFKLPILLLQQLLQQEDVTEDLEIRAVKAHMLLTANEIELSVGTDILKWIE